MLCCLIVTDSCVAYTPTWAKSVVCLLLYYGCIKITLNTSFDYIPSFCKQQSNAAYVLFYTAMDFSTQEYCSTTNLKTQNVAMYFYCQVWLCHIVIEVLYACLLCTCMYVLLYIHRKNLPITMIVIPNFSLVLQPLWKFYHGCIQYYNHYIMLHLVCTYTCSLTPSTQHFYNACTTTGFRNTTELQSFNLQFKLQPLYWYINVVFGTV